MSFSSNMIVLVGEMSCLLSVFLCSLTTLRQMGIIESRSWKQIKWVISVVNKELIVELLAYNQKEKKRRKCFQTRTRVGTKTWPTFWLHLPTCWIVHIVFPIILLPKMCFQFMGLRFNFIYKVSPLSFSSTSFASIRSGHDSIRSNSTSKSPTESEPP